MDLKTELTQRLEKALEKYLTAEAAKKAGEAGSDSGEAINPAAIQIAVETPRNPEHGDFATNLAMLLSRPLRRNPMQIAEELLTHLDREGLVREATIAKPGFINFRVESGAAANVLCRIAEQGAAFGQTQTGAGTRVLIEFVSANPTGPLHIGHARNAVVGDVLGRILAASGCEVKREYYFNDAGVQMDMLGNTLRLRVHEQLGRPVEWPAPKMDKETGELHAQYYKGSYMRTIAQYMIEEFGETRAGDDENATIFYTKFAVREILKMIEADLEAMGIHFDNWFSETSLHRNGAVAATLDELRALGKVYEEDGAQWLRTTEYGDEKDRVVIKSDGNYTYLAPDIAYHRDKYGRGFDRLINVLGGDHHGYVPRLTAAVAALGHPKDALRCVIIQMVSLLKDGATMKLSTRAGEFITFKEMIEELGTGVVRFFFAMRSPDAQMVFDWGLAKDTSMDNPVYYVQYAHARCCSIFRKAEEIGCAYAGLDGGKAGDGADLSLLTLPGEQAILRALGRLPQVVDAAAADLAPHALANYLQETAGLFHNWFTQGTNDPSLRFIVPENAALTQARLALIEGLQTVLANGLRLLGIEPMQKM